MSKKKRLEKPRNPDVEISAGAEARGVRFEKVPEKKTRFTGNTRCESVSGTERENLPDDVQEGVLYRDASVRLRIASKVRPADKRSKGGR